MPPYSVLSSACHCVSASGSAYAITQSPIPFAIVERLRLPLSV